MTAVRTTAWKVYKDILSRNVASWLAVDLVNKIDLLNPFLLLTVYPAHPLHLAMRISVNFRPPRLDYVCVCSIGMCECDVPNMAWSFLTVNVHPGNGQHFNTFPFFIYIESVGTSVVGDSGTLGSYRGKNLRIVRMKTITIFISSCILNKPSLIANVWPRWYLIEGHLLTLFWFNCGYCFDTF